MRHRSAATPLRLCVTALLPLAAALALPAAASAEPAQCRGPLTGRTVTVPTAIGGFGTVEAGKPLPLLRRGEYVVTVDDGPNPLSTGPLLDVLDGACVHAVFMEVGNNAAKHPDLSRAVLAHGDTLGSHSWDHKNFSTMTEAAWHDDVLHGADAVEMAGTAHPRAGAWRFFRIPGAAGVPRVAPPEWMAFLRANHLVLAGYDFSGDDWKNGRPELSFKILMARLADRGVIVFHEGQSNTPAFLRLVLAELQRRGATVVTLRLASH